MKTLSNISINEILKKVEAFQGCFSKDTIPSILAKKKLYYIINLDDIGLGTHWVLVVIEKDKVIYIDPFGQLPYQLLQDLCKSYNKPLYYSTNQLQDMKSNSCGWYCMNIILLMEKGITVPQILYEFFGNNIISNEKRLKQFFSAKKYKKYQ